LFVRPFSSSFLSTHYSVDDDDDDAAFSVAACAGSGGGTRVDNVR
jgi:hypothetical protein